MLVLTRKTNEQIMIGDEIRITLLRIDGNKVRIGIEAPKDIRVIRGELKSFDTKPSKPGEDTDAADQADVQDLLETGQISRREEAFAHPATGGNRRRQPAQAEPKLFVGSVDRQGNDPQLRRAPLADYMTAS